MDIQTTLDLVASSLSAGLPALALQMGVAGILLVAGTYIYKAITPYDEDSLIAQNNLAAGIMLGGTVTALAIPLAATLANHAAAIDVLVWGVVALILQLVFFVAITFRKDMAARIEAGNVASAVATVGGQLAFAMLNAGAMSG